MALLASGAVGRVGKLAIKRIKQAVKINRQ
jgi:hypothetical protein